MDDPTRILICDDDPIVADSIAEFLGGEGYQTATAADGHETLDLLNRVNNNGGDGRYGLVIADMNMPRGGGLELLKALRKLHQSVAVIMITGFGKIASAVEAIKLGAVDYLTKPMVEDELRIAVGKAVQQHTLLAENKTLRDQLHERFGLGSIVGGDYRMQKVYELIEAVAESKTTVLIEGDSGTGKSMVAHAVHTHSPRNASPFVTFSCGSIPETLLESELFGHMKGAFTGADRDKPGKIVAADGGTLFIDEINSATPALQLKLLRVLQEKQFEPVGSTQTTNVDVRFVLATNQPLDELVAAGAFREDLYYRINVVNIKMPLLAERVNDIPLLVEHFLEKFGRETGKQRRLSDAAVEALERYHWPGNVRELENAVERAVVLSRQPLIEVGDLPDTVLGGPMQAAAAGPGVGNAPGQSAQHATIAALAEGWQPMPLTEALADPERQIIHAALEANGWNRQETAKQLNINRTTLYKKIKHYRLDEPQ